MIAASELDIERLWTGQEVAAHLGYSLSWVRQKTRSGELPHVAMGGRPRYEPDQIRAWVARHRVVPGKVIPIRP